MKLNGRQRTPSPDKMQSDGNVSPWRIRVTLEATQDENNQGGPGRKRLGSPTKTTKVPLKDEEDWPMQTPGRRRGRPRKSGAQAPDATATPGSPGNTPGPHGTTGQKRKRGRPRRSVPESGLPENTENTPTHDQTPVAEAEQSWSPLNIAADGDSDDGLPDNNEHTGPFTLDQQMGESGEGTWDRSPHRVAFEPQFDTPDVGAIDRDYTGGDAYLNSTPSKIRSPTRESDFASPGNTLYAGHTPPPRTYPTPTSSSQVDEEPQEQETHPDEFENGLHRGVSHPAADPTDDHREFDSIMESEGFSMVSLDTLPSAKQHGLNSNAKVAKGPLKPFLERESIGITDRMKRKSPLEYNNNREHLSPNKRTSPEQTYPTLPTHSPGSSLPKDPPTASFHSPANKRTSPGRLYPKLTSPSPGPRFSPERLYPKLPSHSPGRRFTQDYSTSNGYTLADDTHESHTTPVVKKRPLPRLARILRVGVALEGTLRKHKASAEFATENCRKRLETLFSDFHPEIQRDLRAGLALANELAGRMIWMETERRKQREIEATATSQNNAREMIEGERPQKEQAAGTINDSPNSEMKRRMAEWQREREAVSREIEAANSSQVVVIDSDTPLPRSPQKEEDDYGNAGDHGNAEDYDDAQSDYEHEPDLGQELKQPVFEEQEPEQPEFDESEDEHHELGQPEPEKPEQDMSDGDDYEDIWQQEARDQSHISYRSSMHQHSDEHQQVSSHTSSSQKSSPVTAPSVDAETSSPAVWARDNSLVPDLGYSRVRQLREQKVDFSPLYRAEYTPRRYNYYYGKSSPQSASKQFARRQVAAEYGKPTHQPEEHSKPSPANGTMSQQRDLTRHESHGVHSDQNQQENEDQYASDDAASEEQSVHEQLDVTPRPPRQANTDIQGSSWFQRLTSFTPGWLRAPKGMSNEDKLPEHEEMPESEMVPKLSSFTPAWLKAPNVQSNEEEFPEGEELPSARSAKEASADLDDPMGDIDEEPESLRLREPSHEQPNSVDYGSRDHIDKENSPVGNYQRRPRPKPLAVSGYFTDEHYAALRRLYRLAKRYPEYFTYYQRPGHSDIIGDWIWTSDGAYGVPVTEGQFAVVDRFAQELADASLENGGPGQIGWTEADLHRRLISIIIGEQVREDRKAKAQTGETRRSESRATSVDIWRP